MMKRFHPSILFLVALLLGGCATTSETVVPPPPDPDEIEPPPQVIIPERDEPPADADVYRGVDLDTVQAGRFDQGRMWTFEFPPIEYLEEAYGFSPEEDWFEDARLSALRIPGCSASFVSPHGLVLTNHHCARDHVTDVSRPGENLLDEGFTATDLEDERPAPNMYADQMIAYRNVTDEIEAALADAQTPAERQAAIDEATSAVQERLEAEFSDQGDNIHVQVIGLYDGALYSAYVFRRYENMRLVMAPALQIGYFGGDFDNFTYPRYALDMALFRVYDAAGEPLDTEHYYEWSENGASVGDLVFVIGNPGSTSRLSTVAQLEFRRDVTEPAVLHLFESRAAAIEAFLAAHPDYDEAEELRNQMFGYLNAAKFYGGTVGGLQNPVLLTRVEDAQSKFAEAIAEDPELEGTYGGLIDDVAAIQREKREYAEEYRAFVALYPGSSFDSDVLQRAIVAYNYLRRQEQGAAPEALQNLADQFASIPEQPDDLSERLLAARLSDIQRAFEPQSMLAQELLQGETPEEVAEAVVNTSLLADSAKAVQAPEIGAVSMDDPAVELVAAFMPQLQAYQSAFAGLNARRQQLARQLGKARFAVYGTEVPPDATFSLRLADGVVKGYEYNGTWAPPHTTFYGLYGHYYSYGPESAWDLPDRWLPAPNTLDLSTPLDFVSTNDLIGGNSGSAVVNRDQEIVGVAFDINVDGLVSDFIFVPDLGSRAVSVDSRGMMEALDSVFDMDRIVLELRTGELMETEAAADARE